MRNLFLVLVLVNLGFAAWHAWFAAPVTPQSATSGPQVPGITLLSELEPETRDSGPAEAFPAPEARLETLSGTASQSTERCVSIGPFRELSQATGAAANLRTAGYAPSQRVAQGDIWVGYWVHIAGLATQERAAEVLADLRENGISDSYVIPGAEDEQTISLGVFSEISRAGRRREEVRRLGYDPSVVDRNRRGTVYWVDVTLAPDQGLDLETLQTPGRIIRLEQRGCQA